MTGHGKDATGCDALDIAPCEALCGGQRAGRPYHAFKVRNNLKVSSGLKRSFRSLYGLEIFFLD